MLEASPLGRPFQPLTLISYHVKAHLFDALNFHELAVLGFSDADLRYGNWEYDLLDMIDDEGRLPSNDASWTS